MAAGFSDIVISLRDPDAGSVCDLARAFNRESRDGLPEILMLFNARNLSREHRTDMLATVFTDLAPDNKDASGLADICACAGQYGFSFPQWRFLAQGAPGTSLFEKYGLKRLDRPTDVRDASLPARDPQRDLYGRGFVRHEGDVTIEYRRAYVLVSAPFATIVIRNNSAFFGRDRLPEAVYVSWQPLTRAALESLDQSAFTAKGPFDAWREAFAPQAGLATAEKIQRIQHLFNLLDREEGRISEWLRGRDGAGHLAQFMGGFTAFPAAAPLYLARTQSHMPPWFPDHTVAANQAVQRDLAGYAAGKDLTCLALKALFTACAGGTGYRLAVLSGPSGDFPVRMPAP